MPKGRAWPSEAKTITDPVSGVEIRQLTDYMGHSHHVYFTNPGWYAGGQKLLIGSDRENRTNLFGLDLTSGEMTQLTDLPHIGPPRETSFLATCLNPARDEAYFWYDRDIVALDLATLELRPLWRAPEGFRRSMLNCTADGGHVCAGIFEDLSNRFRIDYLRGYIGFRETWEAMPLSRIEQVAVDGSGAETVWEERYWIGHVNTSPTQPHLLTFCHEGPWDKVDNRMWCLDLRTRKAWALREREGGEAVGHEYWLADGLYIAYHGRWPDGRKCFGRIRFDNTDRTEVSFPHETGHMHSNDFDLLVGDGSPYVRLWRWNGTGFDGPRILAEHRSSMHIQKTHVHPRFSADGSCVVYTSDVSGYGNVYLAPVPPFGSLPEVPAGK